MLLNLWTLILLRREKHTQFSCHAALNPQAEEHTCWAEGGALDSLSFYSNPKYTWIFVQVKNTSVSTRIALIAIVLIMGSQSCICLNTSSISAWRKRVGVLLLSMQRAHPGWSRTPLDPAEGDTDAPLSQMRPARVQMVSCYSQEEQIIFSNQTRFTSHL